MHRFSFIFLLFVFLASTTQAKTLVILLDGTWNERYEDVQVDERAEHVETNVALLENYLINDVEQNQIVEYLDGVGTTGGWPKDWVQGVFGSGVKKKVQQAFSMVAEGIATKEVKKVAIFGFSRGAATARLLARKIHDSYSDLGLDAAPEIVFLGIWDTVAAMGFPGFSLDEFQKIYADKSRELIIPTNVKRVVHHLAIDEDRTTFFPTLLQIDSVTTSVTELWFPGSHADVGGGWRRRMDESDLPMAKISDLTLYCMMQEAKMQGLLFNERVNDLERFTSPLLQSDAPINVITGVAAYGTEAARKIQSDIAGNRVVIHRSVLNRWQHDQTYRPQRLKISAQQWKHQTLTGPCSEGNYLKIENSVQ